MKHQPLIEFEEFGDLSKIVFLGNNKPLLTEGAYVLAILNRALRGENNPVLDAAIAQANHLNLNVLVYSELNEAGTYACDRLFYFALGAFRDLAQSLAAQHIPCIQTVRKATDAQDPLKTLAARAAAIYTDEDYTMWDQNRLQRIVSVASQSVFFVDAARLVPTRALPPKGLKTTLAFRKGPSALREHYAALRAEATADLEHSTSQLSPYLHFGMLGPHQLFAEINSADVPKTYTWKFRDEFLTWREWSHYITFHNPDIYKFNDQVSLDGRDPATYASLQWAFGHAKPGYSEKPIYGWVAPKSDRAILKRTGMKAWIAARQ